MPKYCINEDPFCYSPLACGLSAMPPISARERFKSVAGAICVIYIAVYEACVDVLAHMTLEQGSRDKYRLELGGISAPKEGQSQRSMKKPQALEHFLSQHPEITEIEVCTDNDFAGRWACEHIRKAYEGSYRIIENLPEIEGADWADMAKMTARTPEKRQRKEVR